MVFSPNINNIHNILIWLVKGSDSMLDDSESNHLFLYFLSEKGGNGSECKENISSMWKK